MVKLEKTQCKREGFERYVDLYVVWEHEGKTFRVRIEPVFKNEYKFLLAHAQDMTTKSDL